MTRVSSDRQELTSLMYKGLMEINEKNISIEKLAMEGAWVAQLVEHLTLDLVSGHDLTVSEMEPCTELCTDSAEPAWDSLSPPPLVRVPSVSQNK